MTANDNIAGSFMALLKIALRSQQAKCLWKLRGEISYYYATGRASLIKEVIVRGNTENTAGQKFIIEAFKDDKHSTPLQCLQLSLFLLFEK